MLPYNVIVIGGGQAGLAMARCLQHRSIDALVLDRGDRPGDSWRQRYDSLVLFTPSQYSSLPDTPFPLPKDSYPTKDQTADYLAAYAVEHQINVRPRSCVRRLGHDAEHGVFTIETTCGEIFHARRVVVATGALQRPFIPSFSAQLASEVVQLHASEYRNPASLPTGRVLIVGAGNSGAQIAEELSPVRDVTMAFDELPRRLPQRFLNQDLFWWLLRLGIMDRTRTDKRSSEQVTGSIPLINSRLPRLLREGVLKRRRRAVGACGRTIQFADGDSLEPDAVLWATGYRNDFSWVELPGALDEHGHPIHHRGVATPRGLFFLGLPGLHTKGSAFLGFVARDADFLAERILKDTT